MSKFDFFEEGVRKVFENFEVPVEENAWMNFESYLSGGAKTISFIKSLILPGVLAATMLVGIHVVSEKHLEDYQHANNLIEQESSHKIIDQDIDLIQDETFHNKDLSSENAESTSIINKDSKSLEGENVVETQITDKSDSKNYSYSGGTTSSLNSYSSKNRSEKVKEDFKEAQNSNTIMYVGRSFRLDAPAKFTPNNDGINDTFMPPALEKTDKFQLFVYNENGDLVFMSDHIENTWTGKLIDSDKDAPEGNYKWTVELSVNQDLHQYTGKVQLFR